MQVGRYEILEIIGTGATGRVGRAHDPMIGRQVAIKLLSKELAEGEGRQRFLQEARVVGQLSHPSIITLHDMGIEETTQTPYLVMEFLEGQPLDRILERGRHLRLDGLSGRHGRLIDDLGPHLLDDLR